MKIIICGAGQVGLSIARQLAADHHITLIDRDVELIQKIGETLDVRAIQGFACHPDILENAGAENADMLIAVTYSDEVNMVACQVGHSLFGIPTKVARIRNQSYLDLAWRELFSPDRLPIDVTISPELEVARAIIRRLFVPGALDIIPFAGGRLKVIAVRCLSECPLVNLPVGIIRQKMLGLHANLIGISHQGNFQHPLPETILSPGDDAYFVADQRDLRRTMTLFGHEEQETRRVIVIGGGNIGLFIAQALEEENEDTRVKIVELSRKRAEHIASQLSSTKVLVGSGLDRDILSEAGISNTDTLIAVTNDDEVNILGSLLAKRNGCRRVITLVNNASLAPLMPPLGIDVAVNPRETTISGILQHVRRGKIKTVHAIHDGAAEILEAEVTQTSPLTGRAVHALELPAGISVCAVVRREEVIIPDANTVIHEYDRVIFLALAPLVKKVEKIFSASAEFF